MDSISKMTPWLGAIFCLVTAGCYNITNQPISEAIQNQHVAISKQIGNMNEDGSYSFGYEDNDGSFKVESRGVLRNIKGTLGFVNDDSEIRKIAYSPSNTTGFKITTAAPARKQVSMLQSILKPNQTSSARRPTIIYATEAPPKSSVVQAIPRIMKIIPTSTITVTQMTVDPTMKPPHQRHMKTIETTTMNITHFNSQQKPVAVLDTRELLDEESQVNHRISEDENLSGNKGIIFARRPPGLQKTLTSMSEEFQNQDKTDETIIGNNLRRQLNENTSAARVGGDEHSDVYGGTLSTPRPLCTTTSASKIDQGISAFRLERPKPIYMNHNNLGRARFEDSIQKYVDTETKDFEDEQNVRQQHMLSQTLQGQKLRQFDRDHTKQNFESLQIRRRLGQQYLREVQPKGIIDDTQPSDDDNSDATTLRPIPFSRILFRPAPNQHNLYSSSFGGNRMRYSSGLADSIDLKTQFSSNPSDLQSRHKVATSLIPRILPSPKHEPEPRQMLHRLTEYSPVNSIDYPKTRVYSHRPHAPWLALAVQPPSLLDPPLSRRDFQTLLRQLLASRFRTQNMGYPKTYLDDDFYDEQPNALYHTSYPIPISKKSPNHHGYEDTSIPTEYGEHFPSIPVFARGRPAFSRVVKQLNPIFKANHYDDYEDSNYAKRIYSDTFYNQESDSDREEVLPPPLREALLLRMLHLAIDNDRPTKPIATMTHPVTTQTTYRHGKTAPVRSVQIISEDYDNEANVSDKGII